MDTPEKLGEWLTKMGYEGKMPPNMRPICNPSTALIWEQLIHGVKPRQEIEHIRNNILINRLLRNNESCSSPSVYLLKHESRYRVKEIETWNKKQKLKHQFDSTRDRISEARSKLGSLSTQNKIKYMNLENIRQKFRENQEYTFLLNAKSKKLEVETAEVEEMLSLACNLTPIESEEQNKAEVLETLKKCSEKLEKIIERQYEVQPAPSILITHSFEMQTPRTKVGHKRRFLSVKKPHSFFSSTKIGHNAKKPKQLDDSLGLLGDLSVTFDNALAASSFKELNFSNVGMPYDLAILNDQQLNELIEGLLYKNDRLVIWNVLAELTESYKAQLISAIVDNDKKNLSSTNLEKKDGVLTKLYATHVEYELKTMRVNFRIQDLKDELSKLQERICANLSHKNAPSRVSELRNYLKLQQKEAGLMAALQHVHKIVNSAQESPGSGNDLQIVKEKLGNVEESIVAKLSCIEHKLNVFKQIYETMGQTRNETCMLARKLGQFTLDPSWTLSLSINLSSTEIDTFLEFPLEYNRTMGATKTFVRDLPINCIPYQDFDTNFVLILVTLLQSPWSPAETLLVDIIRAKTKLELLKTLKYVPDNFNANGYTLEELQNQESYINYALNKLKSLIHAESTNRTVHLLAQVRETVRLWLDMPIRNFIATKRLFNGADYQHYENLFENFYKQL